MEWGGYSVLVCVPRWYHEGGDVESARGGKEGRAERGRRERGRKSRYHCKLTINELALIKEPLPS